MKIETLRLLMCPYCGESLQTSPVVSPTDREIEHGVLSCNCSEFPVVGGIPIFKREGRIDIMKDTEDASLRSGPEVALLIDLIRSGRHEQALMLLLVPPGRYRMRVLRLAGLLPDRHRAGFRRFASLFRSGERMENLRRLTDDSMTALDAFDLLFRRLRVWPEELFNYFGFRFGQPRHLAALSLASLLPVSAEPILDLACGFGHVLHYLATRSPGKPLIGLDRNFFLLYVAKHRMAPAADYVCCEADMTLPFANASFGGVFCSDAFHLFLRKLQCAGEVQRVLRGGGTIVLARFGNALVEPNEGYELTPDSYLKLFDGLRCRLTCERVLLDRYLQKLGPEFGSEVPPKVLAEEKWLSLVAARGDQVFRDHGEFDRWPHALGRLWFNPLYRERGRDLLGNATLEFTFPSEHYKFENSDCRKYMPERISVGKKTLEDLDRGVRSAEIEDLVRTCVLLGMPERYC